MFEFSHFSFQDIDGLIQLIKKVPSSKQVALMSIGSLPSQPSAALCRALSSLGAAKISIVGTNNPNYCLVGYKGLSPGMASEAFGNSTINEVWAEGEMRFSGKTSWKMIMASFNSTTGDPNIYLDYCLANSEGGLPGLANGINVLVFYQLQNLSTRYPPKVFNFPTSNLYSNSSESLSRFIDSLADHTLIMVFAQGLNLAKTNLQQNAISSLKKIGSKFISQYSSNPSNDCWFMIKRIGSDSIFAEMTFNHNSPSTSSFIQIEEFGNGAYSYQVADDINISIMSSNQSSTPVGMESLFYIYVGGVSITLEGPLVNGFVMCAISEIDGHIYFIKNYNIGTTDGSRDMVNDIVDKISVGSLVVVCSVLNSAGPNITMSSDLLTALESIGSEFAYDIVSSSSYALIGRKGAAVGTANELISNTGPVTLFSNFGKITKPIKPFIEIDNLSVSALPGGGYGYSSFMINKQIVDGTNIFSSGLNVLTINQLNGTITSAKNYDTTTDSFNSNKFVADIQALPTGTIVALSTVGPAGQYLGNGVDTIVNYLGGMLIKSFTSQSYCIISTVGQQLTGDKRVISECMSENSYLPTTCNTRFPIKSLFTGSGFSFCVTSMAQSSTASRIMVNGQSQLSSPSSGLNVVTVDHITGATQEYHFDTANDDKQWGLFLFFIQDLKIGTFVLISVQQSIGNPSQEFKDIIKISLSLIGASKFVKVGPSTSYSVIGTKGATPGSAYESFHENAQVCVASWEPRIQSSSLLKAPLIYGQIPDEPLMLNVPLLSNYHQLATPISKLAPSKPLGNVFMNEPAYWKTKRPSSGNIVKALLIGVSYNDNPAGPIKGVDFSIQEHCRALVNCGYVKQENIRVLTENTSQVSLDGTYVCRPTTICIKDQINNWLVKDVVEGDVIYIVFSGRSFVNTINGVSTYGLCTLIQDPQTYQYRTDYSLTSNELQQLFVNIPWGVTITFLLDCSYAFEMVRPGIISPDSFDNFMNGLFSVQSEKQFNTTQLTSGFLPLITGILLDGFNQNSSPMLYSQIIAKASNNPLYPATPYLFKGESHGSDLVFLSPFPHNGPHPVYRFSTPVGDQLQYAYTTSPAMGAKWSKRTLAWKILPSSSPIAGVPLYQFTKPQTWNGQNDAPLLYFLSVNPNIGDGWTNTGSIGKVFASPLSNGLPIRQFRSTSAVYANITMYAFESTTLVDPNQSWIDNGVVFFSPQEVDDPQRGAIFSQSGMVSVPHIPAYNFGTNDFSISVSFKTTASGSIVCCKGINGGVGSGGWTIDLKQGRIDFIVHDGTVGTFLQTQAPGVTNGQWHTLACVRKSGVLFIYLDQKLLSQMNTTTPLNVTNTTTMTFGQNPPTPNQFSGVMSNMAIWNAAIDPTQLQNLNQKDVKSIPNLVGYWNFLQDSFDTSSMSNNGTINAYVNFTPPVATNCIQIFQNGQVSIPSIAAYNVGTNDFSVTFLIQASSIGPLVSRKPMAGGAGNGGFRITLGAGGIISFVTDTGSNEKVLQSIQSPALNGINMSVACVRQSNQMMIYFDTTLVASVSGSAMNINNSAPLQFGQCLQLGPSAQYLGKISRVTFWNKAIDVVLMDKAYKGTLSNELGLIGNWLLQSDGLDSSPTKNNSMTTLINTSFASSNLTLPSDTPTPAKEEPNSDLEAMLSRHKKEIEEYLASKK
ncbi:hypothetical protein DFA_08892 [Cavenderia fasciculata]|uniref:Laminin G domain-containing protein n=1 Tax=Cavenderia fasciculata TaxID=261658 RepID=F4Q4U5_CACFS|nr:uncharacterized protein DFA_08892 [Cavenderia fasciculata]EGG17891.1 hypothetical protein DFA_08892 [Cavenderia fasciculata]|eukprot:XP_004356375.1 hypothetical protein DFA_08892 [Cavenderia fasciculata]